MRDLWTFDFRKEKMEKEDLEAYQRKLLNIRDNYSQQFTQFEDSYFYTGELPPPDNIFAQFKYKCQNHVPECKGK